MPRGMVWSDRVRDTQSATQVNTIRPGKLARQRGMREAKSVKSGTSGTGASTEKGRCWGLSGGWWWNGGRSDERQTWETCLRVKERSSCRLERPKNRAGAGVRASVVAQAN
jgi:hypothetical protein